jgi:hypothetical protein
MFDDASPKGADEVSRPAIEELGSSCPPIEDQDPFAVRREGQLYLVFPQVQGDRRDRPESTQHLGRVHIPEEHQSIGTGSDDAFLVGAEADHRRPLSMALQPVQRRAGQHGARALDREPSLEGVGRSLLGLLEPARLAVLFDPGLDLRKARILLELEEVAGEKFIDVVEAPGGSALQPFERKVLILPSRVCSCDLGGGDRVLRADVEGALECAQCLNKPTPPPMTLTCLQLLPVLNDVVLRDGARWTWNEQERQGKGGEGHRQADSISPPTSCSCHCSPGSSEKPVRNATSATA